jgi:hypothetical protein
MDMEDSEKKKATLSTKQQRVEYLFAINLETPPSPTT